MWELLLDNIIRRVARFCVFYKSLLKLFLTSLCGCKHGSAGNQTSTCTGLQVLGSSELMKQINPILRISIMCFFQMKTKQFTWLQCIQESASKLVIIHLSARASTSQPGHPPLWQCNHFSAWAATSSYFSARMSTSQPGHSPLSNGIHL